VLPDLGLRVILSAGCPSAETAGLGQGRCSPTRHSLKRRVLGGVHVVVCQGSPCGSSAWSLPALWTADTQGLGAAGEYHTTHGYHDHVPRDSPPSPRDEVGGGQPSSTSRPVTVPSGEAWPGAPAHAAGSSMAARQMRVCVRFTVPSRPDSFPARAAQPRSRFPRNTRKPRHHQPRPGPAGPPNAPLSGIPPVTAATGAPARPSCTSDRDIRRCRCGGPGGSVRPAGDDDAGSALNSLITVGGTPGARGAAWWVRLH
jgi:hypothetical protein